MIQPFVVGLIVSILVIFSFLKINYLSSIDKWILETSQFIYYSGHPLLNEDEIFEEITSRYKSVFISLIIVIFKTMLFLSIVLVLISISSIILDLLVGSKLPDIDKIDFLFLLFPSYLIEPPFLLGSLLPIVVIPYLIQKREVEKKRYSPISKFLHYTFLGNKNIAIFLFNIELLLHKKQLKEKVSNKNIYISGFARAGTTVLMQYLGQLSEFKSVSYRNLPFLFLPKSWPKCISKKTEKNIERFHQDGILHNINSYEALEEPFWRNFLGQNYILKNKIISHTIDLKIFTKYVLFRKLISNGKIYLAKNNNHLLRAESLHKLDRENGIDTTTIIPFRWPYEQAKSLLRQHVLLSNQQSKDIFTLDYMDFLVHHEFGLNNKISLFDDFNIDSIRYMDKCTIEYWLEVWFIFYDKVYEKFKNQNDLHFFCYESFVSNPKKSIKSILSTMELPVELVKSIVFTDFHTSDINKSCSKNDKYNSLYSKLKQNAMNDYG